jgi:DNA-directed RNA polymerase subunit RPC12/RpoP
MFLIIGTKYRFSGSERTAEQNRCQRCGAMTQFIRKTGRNYLTLFFVLPLFPVGKAHNVLECPNCGARYETGNF